MDFKQLWTEFNLKNDKQNSRCLAVNTVLAGKYLVGPVLGQGGFGITYIGYDLNMETKIAIKEYFPIELVSRDTTTMHGDRVLSLSGEKSITYQQGLKKYVAEAQNVSQFSEVPGVVSVKDFFYENETAYIVMEYIDGISLKDYLKEKGGRLSEEETLQIMKPVLEALVQVHGAGIIHRDISPDNIMLTFEEEQTGGRKIKSVKLIDFGAARMTAKDDQKSLTIILKHGYAPEEQYRTHGEQGPWTDVYAVCAVLYRMLTGETPVPAMDRMFKDELKSFEDLGVKVGSNTTVAILKGLAVKKDDRIQSMQELIGVLYEGNKLAQTGGKGKKSTYLLAAGIGGALLLAAVLFLMIGRGNAPASSHGSLISSGEQAADCSDASAGAQTGEGSLKDEEGLLALDPKEDNIEQIVWTKPEVMLAGGDDHVISLRDDGTVLAAGNNDEGRCEVTDWDNIAAVYTSRSASVGLRKDGTVVVAGNEQLKEGVSSWQGIVDISAGTKYILGCTADGRVLSAGNNDNGCCETGDWTDIVSVWSAAEISFGITKDGKLKIAGTSEHYGEDIAAMEQWEELKQVGFVVGAACYYGLKTDGTVVCTSEEYQEELSSWSQVTMLVSGEYYIAGLREDGTILSTRKGEAYEEWKNVVSIAGTSYNLIGLQEDGTLIVSGQDGGVFYEDGIYTMEEIQSMDDIRQAVWVDDHLAVLREDGTVNIVAKPDISSVSKLEIPQWTDVVRLEEDGSSLIGIASDQTVLREEKSYISMSVSALEMSPEEGSKRRDQTPRLYNSWQNVVAVSSSGNHIAALMEDGTVKAAGFPEHQPTTDYKTGLTTDGACEVDNWTDICQVLARLGNTIGLKKDGTLVWTSEQTDYLEHFENLKSIWGTCGDYDYLVGINKDGTVQEINLPMDSGMTNVHGWTDMVQLALSDVHIVGLRADGTVLAAGSNFCGQCDVEDWTDVVSITVGPSSTVGVTADGRVLMAGTFPNDLFVAEDWPAVSLEKLLKEKAQEEVQSTVTDDQNTVSFEESTDELGEQIVYYHPQNSMDSFVNTLFICMPDGTVKVIGTNENNEYDAADWTGVVSVKTGYYHTLGLRQDGTVLVTEPAGEDYGQYDVEHWSNVVDIAAGQLLSLGVTADGHVLVAGNGNSKRIDLNHLGAWTDIKQIAHSMMDTIAGLKYDGTVVLEGEHEASISGWENVEELFFLHRDILVGMEADGTVHAVLLQREDNQFAEDDMKMVDALNSLPKMKQISCHGVGITAEGTTILPEYEEGAAAEWNDMVNVVYWYSGYCGIQTDGTFVNAYQNCGNAEPEDFTDLVWVRLTESVNAGSYTGMMGQTGSGQVLYYGANSLFMEWIDQIGGKSDITDVEERMIVTADGKMYVPGGYAEQLPDSGVREAIYSSEGCVLLMEDGTVRAYGMHVDMHQCEEAVKSWKNIVQICGADQWVCGLKADGTVVFTGNSKVGVSDIESIYGSKDSCFGIKKDGSVVALKVGSELESGGMLQAEQWTDMTELAVGASHIVGLKSDGTVVAAGSNVNGQCDVEDWKNVVSIDAAGGCTIGLTKDGELLMAGALY